MDTRQPLSLPRPSQAGLPSLALASTHMFVQPTLCRCHRCSSCARADASATLAQTLLYEVEIKDGGKTHIIGRMSYFQSAFLDSLPNWTACDCD